MPGFVPSDNSFRPEEADRPPASPVLVVHRDSRRAREIAVQLRDAGFDAEAASPASAAREHLVRRRFDGLVTEVSDRVDGLALLRIFLDRNPGGCGILLADLPANGRHCLPD
ncbi:MAG TPA: hypothetical protein PLO53_09415, partial [Candidatus Hydrogenedentes bacterium]|nr:hypothetical protein [Candidatus Hydrogenedentota bacterium]